MKLFKIFLPIILIVLMLSSCDDSSVDSSEYPAYYVINFPYINAFNERPDTNRVISTQSEYKEMINRMFSSVVLLKDESALPYLREGAAIKYPEYDSTRIDSLAHAILDTLKNDSSKGCLFFREIDFTKYTLLYQGMSVTGCPYPEYRVSVEKDNRRKQIIYTLAVTQKGQCEPIFNIHAWVQVEKLEPGWSVEFRQSLDIDLNP